MTGVHVVIPTHTTRGLAECVGALARQSTPPVTVVVTCDGDREDIAGCLAGVRAGPWAEAEQNGWRAPDLIHVWREHPGAVLLNQVRNNGLRRLEGRAEPGDHVVMLDGDTLLAPDAIGRHLELSRAGADIVIPYRINLSEGETPDGGLGAFVERALTRNRKKGLAKRALRYRRQLAFRRMAPWTVKGHKPKIIGGHHGVRWSALKAVNGYDEVFEEYGFDDDDLTRRLYLLRPKPKVAIAVRQIIALHLWHPSRAPGSPTDSPMYERFRDASDRPQAAKGLVNPRGQADVHVSEIKP